MKNVPISKVVSGLKKGNIRVDGKLGIILQMSQDRGSQLLIRILTFFFSVKDCV